MSANRLALDNLIASVADGTAELDWEALESVVETEDDRRLLQQLRVLARISEVHRSEPDSGLMEDSSFDEDLADLSSKVIGRIEPRTPPPAAITPEAALAGPSSWGHLRLVERVGHGSYGDVFRAFDTQLHREVAVKLLRVNPDVGELTARLLREGRALARVRHPNVVVVHGAEAREGRVGLWMEFIRGATLEELLRSQGAFGAREAAVLGQDLCRAMAAVHAAGLVHRDIKAQNVMREAGGRVVLMDFGAGQLRHDASRGSQPVTGTPLYLAPELLDGADASIASDVYSIGVLLYRLVTLDFPIHAETIEALRQAHAGGGRMGLRDVRPDLPDWYVAVVERALATSPSDRFASAGALQSALGVALGGTADHVVPSAPPTTEPQRLPGERAPSARTVAGGWRPWRLAGLAALVTLSALTTTAWWMKTTPVTATIASVAPVIAVMPFDRGMGASDHATDDLRRRVADHLGRLPGVRVVSETSSRMLKPAGGAADTKVFAASGGPAIDVVVDGQVRSTDPTDVVVRLSRAGAATPLWSAAFKGAPGDVVARLVERVGASLHIAGGAATVPAARAESPEVAELVARGRLALERGMRERTEAVSLLKHAVLLDPEHARAHAGLARAHWELGCRAQISEARASAERAIALDAGLAEAHTVLGDIAFRCEWRWETAHRHYEAAVAANPSDEFSRRRYGMFLAARGDPSAGLVQMTHARALDALSATARTSTATLLIYNRRFDEAEQEVRGALELDSKLPAAHLVHGRALMALGRFVEASRAFAVAEALDNPAGQQNIRVEIAAADAAAGREAQARKALRALEARSRSIGSAGGLWPETLAFAYARLGDRERAFDLLEEAIDRRSELAVWLPVDSRAEPLRSDPRFAPLLRRLDLDVR